MQDIDRRHMMHALSLGQRGAGQTWPNPSVGCVIVNEGRIVGRGFTQPSGRPHAETEALFQAGEQARGATAYVTLEPCSHQGETPPCADALIAAGIARVVAPFEDDDPRVSGRGFSALRAAGVEVTTGVLSDVAARDHAGFFLKINEGRPLITLKLATSVDGRIALASGESQWITGRLARKRVQGLRSRHDAVMIGGGTARIDNPRLTLRDFGSAQQPVRIVLSKALDLPFQSNLQTTIDQAPLWIVHGKGADASLMSAWEGCGARLFECDMHMGHLDIRSVLKALGHAGLTRIFCEGGGQLAAALLEHNVVDRLVHYTAGFPIGADGLAAVGALGAQSLTMIDRFELDDIRSLGPDTVTYWRRS